MRKLIISLIFILSGCGVIFPSLTPVIERAGTGIYNELTSPNAQIDSAAIEVSLLILDAADINPEWDVREPVLYVLDKTLIVLNNEPTEIKKVFDFIAGTEDFLKLVKEKPEYGIIFKIARRRIETRIKQIQLNVVDVSPQNEAGLNNLKRFLTGIRDNLRG